MGPSRRMLGRLGLVTALCLLVGVSPGAVTQKAPAPGAASKAAITFTDYHGYTGAADYLKRVAAAYPAITELIEIGRSNTNRPVFVLIVTNRKTGVPLDSLVPLRHVRLEGKEPVKNVTPMKPDQAKPGVWIDGGTHGNEYTGTEVCLYIIDKLVSGYGADADLTRLIDASTFYICPTVNPDGVFNSVEKGIAQRGNSMIEDNDGDGKVNEDGPDDLDGDGVLRQFRYRDPKGQFVISEADPRIMVRLAQNETTSRPRYAVITEDRDNDGDGRRGEDGESGIDVNRNFPEGWYRDTQEQGGTGAYPSSSPESRAVLEFFTNHTNILMVQSYHTSGGFTYRPLARWPDSRLDAKDLAVYDRVMGKKYLQLIGEPVPAAWQDAKPPAAVPGRGGSEAGLADDQQPQGRGRAAAAAPRATAQAGPGAPAPPRGFRHPYNDTASTPYGYGVFLDWAYAQFGAYAMSTELWNWQKDTKGLAGYAGEDDRVKWEAAYIGWQEKALGGRAFKAWTPFKHPELGDGEIGGWTSRYGSGNAIPGESLLGVCEVHWQFERFKASLLPRLDITSAKGRVLYTTNDPGVPSATAQGDTVTIAKGRKAGRYRIIEITAAVANTGPLATHLGRGASLRGNRGDVVWLIGDRDRIRFLQGTPWVRLGTLDGTMPIPGYQPRPQPSSMVIGAMTGRGRGGFGGGAAPIEGQLRLQRPEETRMPTDGATREITWLVAVEGDVPLTIVLSSQKGGTVVKDVAVN